MYCTQCGTIRPGGATACPGCGMVPAVVAAPAQIPNYLVQSILVTLCCCVPAGIVAIVYAAQVNSKVAAGDFAGAQESSRLAKIWSWVGFGLGVLIGIIYAIAGAMGSFNNIH
jgi:hypothetical protein